MFWFSFDDNMFTEMVVGFIGIFYIVQKTTIRMFLKNMWVDKTICNALKSCTAAYNVGLVSGNGKIYKAS